MTIIGLQINGNRVDLVNIQANGQNSSCLDARSSVKKGIRKAEWYHIGRRTQITIGSKTVHVVTDSLAKYLARTSIEQLRQTENAKKTAFKTFKKVALEQEGTFASAIKIGNLLQRHIAIYQHRERSCVEQHTVSIPQLIQNFADAKAWEVFFQSEDRAYCALSEHYRNLKSSSFMEALNHFNDARHSMPFTSQDTQAIKSSVLMLNGDEISTITQKLQDNAKALNFLNPLLELKERSATLKDSIKEQEDKLEQLRSELQNYHQIEQSFARLQTILNQHLSNSATILTLSIDDIAILSERDGTFAQQITSFNTHLTEYKKKLAAYEAAQKEYELSENDLAHTSKQVQEANDVLTPLLKDRHTPVVKFSKENRDTYLSECEKMGIYQLEELINDLKKQLAQKDLTAQDTQRTKDITVYNAKLEQQKKLLSFFALNPTKRKELLNTVNAEIEQTQQQIEVTHNSSGNEDVKAIQLSNLEPQLLIFKEQKHYLELLIGQEQPFIEAEQKTSEEEQTSPAKRGGVTAKLKEKAALFTKGASLATKAAASMVSKAATKAMKVAKGKSEIQLDDLDSIQQAKAVIEARIEEYKKQIKETKTTVKAEAREATEQNEPVQFVIQQLQHILAQKEQHLKTKVQDVCKTFNLRFKDIKELRTDIFERLAAIQEPLKEQFVRSSQKINITKQAFTQSDDQLKMDLEALNLVVREYRPLAITTIETEFAKIESEIETKQTEINTLEEQFDQQWQTSQQALTTICPQRPLTFNQVYAHTKQAAIINHHFLLAIANPASENLASLRREMNKELEQMKTRATVLDIHFSQANHAHNPFILTGARHSLLGEAPIDTYLQPLLATEEELRFRSNSTRSAASRQSGLSHTSISLEDFASSEYSIYSQLFEQASSKTVKEVLLALDGKNSDFLSQRKPPLFNEQTKIILEMTLLDADFVEKLDLGKIKESIAHIDIDLSTPPKKIIYQVLLQGARDKNDFKQSFQALLPTLTDLVNS